MSEKARLNIGTSGWNYFDWRRDFTRPTVVLQQSKAWQPIREIHRRNADAGHGTVRSDFLSSRGCPGISGIRCSRRLNQQNARVPLRVGLVLNATRHHEQLSRTENHGAIA